MAIPDELLALRDSVRSFLAREVQPVEDEFAEELTNTGQIDHRRAHQARRRIRGRSVEAGFYAMHLPEELGGMGVSHLGAALVHETIGASGMYLAGRGAVIAGSEGPTTMLSALDADQRRRFVEPLVRGQTETCFGLSEPEAGSDALKISTRATRIDSGWLVNGRKHFITNGQFADFMQLFVKAGDAETSITFMLVDMGTEGVTVAREMRTTGADVPAEIVFEDAFVPDENVVGKVGEGLVPAMTWVNESRVNLASTVLGGATHLLDRMIKHAQEREAFGRPIGRYQFVQEHIVSSAIELESIRPLVYEAAHAIDQGSSDARKLAAMAKLIATEAGSRIADRAIQVFGGSGVDVSTGIERYWRDLRATRLYEGTSEILKITIAKSLGL